MPSEETTQHKPSASLNQREHRLQRPRNDWHLSAWGTVRAGVVTHTHTHTESREQLGREGVCLTRLSLNSLLPLVTARYPASTPSPSVLPSALPSPPSPPLSTQMSALTSKWQSRWSATKRTRIQKLSSSPSLACSLSLRNISPPNLSVTVCMTVWWGEKKRHPKY